MINKMNDESMDEEKAQQMEDDATQDVNEELEKKGWGKLLGDWNPKDTSVCATATLSVSLLLAEFTVTLAVCGAASGGGMILVTAGTCTGIIFGIEIGISIEVGVGVFKSIDKAPGYSISMGVGVEVSAIAGGGFSAGLIWGTNNRVRNPLQLRRQSNDCLGASGRCTPGEVNWKSPIGFSAGISVGVSVGASVGSISSCNDVIVYANDRYRFYIQAMGVGGGMKKEMPTENTKYINADSFYLGCNKYAECCPLKQPPLCPIGYTTYTTARWPTVTGRCDGFCFGDPFIKKRRLPHRCAKRKATKCVWTGQVQSDFGGLR